MCGMTSCVEPSRETGGREKRRETYGGRKFIASYPRGVHVASRGKIWRVEKGPKCRSSTTFVESMPCKITQASGVSLHDTTINIINIL